MLSLSQELLSPSQPGFIAKVGKQTKLPHYPLGSSTMTGFLSLLSSGCRRGPLEAVSVSSSDRAFRKSCGQEVPPWRKTPGRPGWHLCIMENQDLP